MKSLPMALASKLARTFHGAGAGITFPFGNRRDVKKSLLTALDEGRNGTRRISRKGITDWRTLISVQTITCLLLLGPQIAFAQDDTKRDRIPSVTATGEAVITAEPDLVELDIGVVSQARNAPDAAKENAEKLTRVLAEVKKLLGKDDEVKTASYSLNPNYRYPQGGKPEITGYTATNVLRIKTGNLSGVGKLIDASMQAGANAINRLAFTLRDEHAAQLRALRHASQKAKAKAEEMAGALGLSVTRVLNLAEVDRAVRPIVMPVARDARFEVAAAPPTPVEAGSIEIRSTVTLTAELGIK
jgi:uncharacterized protein YggE